MNAKIAPNEYLIVSDVEQKNALTQDVREGNIACLPFSPRRAVAIIESNILIDEAAIIVFPDGNEIPRDALILANTLIGANRVFVPIDATDTFLTQQGQTAGTPGWLNGDYGYRGAAGIADIAAQDYAFTMQEQGSSE